MPERLPYDWTNEIGLPPDKSPGINNPRAGANLLLAGQISAVIWNLDQ